MSWCIKYNQNKRIVEVIYNGTVTSEDMRTAVVARIQVQDEHNSHLVLIDCSQVELIAGGIGDVHNLSDKIYEDEKVNRRTWHALVLSERPKTHRIAFHYETACFNRGWRVKIFETREDALGWLQGTTRY